MVLADIDEHYTKQLINGLGFEDTELGPGFRSGLEKIAAAGRRLNSTTLVPMTKLLHYLSNGTPQDYTILPDGEIYPGIYDPEIDGKRDRIVLDSYTIEPNQKELPFTVDILRDKLQISAGGREYVVSGQHARIYVRPT